MIDTVSVYKKGNNVHETVCIVRCIFVFFVLIEAFKIVRTLLPAIDPKTNTPTPQHQKLSIIIPTSSALLSSLNLPAKQNPSVLQE